MDDQTKERWFQLCQLAAVEKAPDKLLALVTEINQLLEAKETERDVKKGRQGQAWNEKAETDQHQNQARQPYRSREKQSHDAANDSTHSRPNGDPSGDSEN